MIRQPWDVPIDPDGRAILPLGLLAEAGLDPGITLVGHSDGDGRIVLRRANDALDQLLADGDLT